MMCEWYCVSRSYGFFFFNDTATTEIYTLSLHDALPILPLPGVPTRVTKGGEWVLQRLVRETQPVAEGRSEEHTFELQSRQYLVCRLLLEKKKTITEICNVTKL